MVNAANQRAFEHWMASSAAGVAVPWRAYTSASVAIGDPAHQPTVVIVIGLRSRAWLALGLLHLWAWWKVSEALGDSRQGYNIKVWVI